MSLMVSFRMFYEDQRHIIEFSMMVIDQPNDCGHRNTRSIANNTQSIQHWPHISTYSICLYPVTVSITTQIRQYIFFKTHATGCMCCHRNGMYGMGVPIHVNDDTILYTSGPSLHSVLTTLQMSFNAIQLSFRGLQLLLNTSKIKCMLFNRSLPAPARPCSITTLDGSDLEYVDNYKYPRCLVRL